MERRRAADFDPQLLTLFDKYVHGHISRREFLDGASRFAVGGVTATALWEMLRPNYDEAAAKLAWQRTIDHPNKTLRS